MIKKFVLGPAGNGRIQFLRYLFVGGSAAVVDLTLYGVMTEGLRIHYLLAAFFAYMVGLVWNYLLSILWVFDKSRHKRTKEITLVFLISIGGLFWTELLLYLFVEYGGIYHFSARIIALWIVLAWNFGMRKIYVFH